MSLSELLMEWEDRLFDSERVLLTEELEARSYRIKSLEPPAGDLPDGDAEAVRQGTETLAAEADAAAEESDEADIAGGAKICFAIAAFTMAAHAMAPSGVHAEGLGSWIRPVGIAVAFLVLGRAILRGSKQAAFTALALYGVESFLQVWAMIEAISAGDEGDRLRSGGSVLLFIGLFRSAVALARRSRASAADPSEATDAT